jgi:hypothetical protein
MPRLAHAWPRSLNECTSGSDLLPPILRPPSPSGAREQICPRSLDAGARTFTCAAGASPEEALLGVLESVDLHHGEYSHDPPWSVLEVLGCAPTAAVEVAAAEYGARVEPGPPAHFEIVRAIAARS